MTYQEAFNIGSSATGYVKCTYAKLYRMFVDRWNNKHNHVFSFQRTNTVASRHTDWGGDIDAEMLINYEMPIVIATTYSEDKLVSVRLTAEAREIIRKCLAKKSIQKRIELEDILDATEIVYVKPIACDWIPNNITSMDDEIAAAKKKVDNAKAILAMATATIII